MKNVYFRFETAMSQRERNEIRRMPHEAQLRLHQRWEARAQLDYNSSDWSADSAYTFSADQEIVDILANRRLDYVLQHANQILADNGQPIVLEVQDGMPIPRNLLDHPEEEFWRENI